MKLAFTGVDQIDSTGVALSAVLKEGTAAIWGDKDPGGDCSYVKVALKRVDQTYCTGETFAAVLKDGAVVTWGGKDAVVCEGGVNWS